MSRMQPLARLGVVAATTLLVGTLAGPAFAHVTANPSEGNAGAYAASAFRVGHGCDGSPTLAVRVQIPDGVSSVHPQAKAGWEIEITEGELAEPIEGEDGEITEGVTEVAWTGGSLDDAHYDDFGLSMKLPDTPGETLYFPFIQECEEGENAWVNIPPSVEEWHDTEDPAPYITLTEGGGHGDGEEAGSDEAATTAGGGADDEAGGEEVAAAEPVSADAADDAPLASATTTDDGTDPLALGALIVGLSGLGLGGAALLRSRRA